MCENSKWNQKRNRFKKKFHNGEEKSSRQSETCVRDLCPVATLMFIYQAGHVNGKLKITQLTEQ